MLEPFNSVAKSCIASLLFGYWSTEFDLKLLINILYLLRQLLIHVLDPYYLLLD